MISTETEHGFTQCAACGRFPEGGYVDGADPCGPLVLMDLKPPALVGKSCALCATCAIELAGKLRAAAGAPPVMEPHEMLGRLACIGDMLGKEGGLDERSARVLVRILQEIADAVRRERDEARRLRVVR